MIDIVECHSGFTYTDRPTALTWQGKRLIISEILSEGRTPQIKWFRVRTADGEIFELSYIELTDKDTSEYKWQIHQF